MNKKLVVTDYDGVVKTVSNGEIILKDSQIYNSLNNVAYMNISTGRVLECFIDEINNFSLKYDFLTCSNGNVVFDKNLKVLRKNSFNMDSIKEIYSFNKIIKAIDYMNEYGQISKDIFEIVLYLEEKQEYRKKIVQFLSNSNRFDYVTDSNNRYIIHVYNKSNKTSAVEYLKTYLNINNKDIYTIGDGLNDVAMMEKYNGYCLNNSIKGNFKNCHNLESVIDKIKVDVARSRRK